MFQNTDDNPYRSPAPYDGDEQPEIATPVAPDGVWRWRQAMIVRRSKPVFPQACVLSNVSGNFFPCPTDTVSPLGLWPMFVASQVPGIGVLLLGAILLILKTLGLAWVCRLPVRLRVIMFLPLLVGVMSVLLLGGNFLSAYGLYNGKYHLALLGLMLSLLAVAMDWASDRFFLRTHFISSEYVAIEGIHSEYLDRLPEFPYPTDHKIFTRP